MPPAGKLYAAIIPFSPCSSKQGKFIGHRLCYAYRNKEVIGMIYCCQTKCCHYLFCGSEQQTPCPDCGHKRIRPATREERAAFFRQRTALLAAERRPG